MACRPRLLVGRLAAGLRKPLASMALLAYALCMVGFNWCVYVSVYVNVSSARRVSSSLKALQ